MWIQGQRQGTEVHTIAVFPPLPSTVCKLNEARDVHIEGKLAWVCLLREMCVQAVVFAKQLYGMEISSTVFILPAGAAGSPEKSS